MKVNRGQAFDTMKLLIAAIVAVAILSILNVIISGIPKLIYCDPYTDVTSLLREVSNSPGITRVAQRCLLGAEEIFEASALKTGSMLTTQNLVIVCGPGMETACTNGMYPTTTDTTVLNDMGKDSDIIEYWGGAGTYANQKGQIGPSSTDLPVKFRVRCGEMYCSVTVLAG